MKGTWLKEAETHPTHDVFGIEDADDVLGSALRIVDGNAGVLFVGDAGEGFFETEIGGQGKDSSARDHDLASGNAIEFEGIEKHFFLGGGKLSGGARGTDDEPELVGGVDGPVADFVGAEGAEDEAGGAAHEDGEGRGHGEKDIHGCGDGEGDAFGALQGERFWDEFSEDDVQAGDENEGDGDGDGMGVEDGVGNTADQGFDEACQYGLAQPSEGKAGDGDSELDSVDHAAELLMEFEDSAGTDAAGFDELLDAGFADADEREFGGRKEGIGRDNEQDDEHPQQHECNHGGVILTFQRDKGRGVEAAARGC